MSNIEYRTLPSEFNRLFVTQSSFTKSKSRPTLQDSLTFETLKHRQVVVRIIGFLVVNFGALALGAQFTGDGVPSEWYQTLNKAPWTPPGWVFGAAWTTIMICFSIYMAKAYDLVQHKKELIGLYALQLGLNISWNPIFFKYHAVDLGLVTITSLTIVIFIFLFMYKTLMKNWSALLLPYAIWLVIATSLNAYVCLMN